MKGGGHDTMPDNYVKDQAQVNSLHTDGYIESGDECDHYEARCAHIGQINHRAPASILDVGCRTGVSLEVIKSCFPNARVVGVEIVPELAALACRHGEAYCADAHALPFANGEFEWVISVGTFEHMYNVKRAASEMRRVATVGIYVTCDLEDDERFASNPSHYTQAREEEWIDALAAAGWRLVSRQRLSAPADSVELIYVTL